MADQDGFDSHCIIELFGHQKIAGKVTEQIIAGQGFVRVDVPETKRHPAFTRLFGAGAIYSITPVSEDIAQRAAESIWVEPITAFAIPQIETGIEFHPPGYGMDEMDGAGPGEEADNE